MNKVQLPLQVPFSAKDQAKSLGARWDPAARSWYVPHGVDIQPFKPWWPAGLQDAPSPTAATRASLAPKTAPRTSGAAAVYTGPGTVAVDASDKLPWED